MDETSAGFLEIYTRWYRKMVVYAATFAYLSADETEDLAHDALVHAWYRLDRYDRSKPFSPWLYRLTRNFIIDYLRRRPPTVPLEGRSRRETGSGAARVSGGLRGSKALQGGLNPSTDGEGDFSEPISREMDPAERAVAADLESRVDAVIAGLCGDDRRVAMLVMREGLNAREAGEALGMNANTVRWRAARVRSKVRAALGREDSLRGRAAKNARGKA